MKMAKPSEQDIEAAGKLAQILNAIDSNNGYWQSRINDTPDFYEILEGDEGIDPDNDEHLRALYNAITELLHLQPSFHNRVIGGMCHVIMWDKNEIVNPDCGHIDLHPRFYEAFENLKRETQSARYWNKRYHEEREKRELAESKLAEIHSEDPVYQYQNEHSRSWTDCDKDLYDIMKSEYRRIIYLHPPISSQQSFEISGGGDDGYRCKLIALLTGLKFKRVFDAVDEMSQEDFYQAGGCIEQAITSPNKADADAVRYRFLRDSEQSEYTLIHEDTSYRLVKAEFDGAIDEIMFKTLPPLKDE